LAASDPMGIIGVRTITNQQQIYSILTSVQKARSPITVKIENRERYYTSLILQTNLDEGFILIDEIAPEDGHHLVMQNLPFSIRGSHNGVSLFFRPNVIAGSGVESDIAFYKVKLPKEMIYQQRRAAFRAQVARSLRITGTVTSQRRRDSLTGILHDISLGGCRINFSGEINQDLVRSDKFEECNILLPDGYSINCPLSLKHATYIRDWDETTCGFQFEGLDTISQRAIDRFVYFLQREARRLETK